MITYALFQLRFYSCERLPALFHKLRRCSFPPLRGSKPAFLTALPFTAHNLLFKQHFVSRFVTGLKRLLFTWIKGSARCWKGNGKEKGKKRASTHSRARAWANLQHTSSGSLGVCGGFVLFFFPSVQRSSFHLLLLLWPPSVSCISLSFSLPW